MEKAIGKNTGSSSSSSSNRGRVRVPGIPKECWCGSRIVERISGTDENPYRRYYRCAFAATNRLRHDPHVFKWVDEAFGDEIGQLDYQVGVLEEAVTGLKDSSCVINVAEFENQFEKLRIEIVGTVEDGLMEAKKSMKRMLALVFCASVLMVVLGILVKKCCLIKFSIG